MSNKMNLILEGLAEQHLREGYYVTTDIKDSDIDFAAESVAKYLKRRNLSQITTEDVIEQLRSLSDMWDDYWAYGLRTKKQSEDFLKDFLKRLEKYGIRDVIDNTFESSDYMVDGPDFKNDYCVYVHKNPRVKPRYFKDLTKAEAFAKKKLKDLEKSKTNKLIPGYIELVISQGDKIIKSFS